VQVIGIPESDIDLGDAAAIVVALKSRTIPPEEAVRQSLDALAWLKAQGASHFFFKYCSTFDSTDEGNIGQVADALLDALDTDFTIACPAFPTNGRTVYKGHLFVGDQLLSESGMKDHPLTPMTDANIVRVLGRQTNRPVGLIGHEIVGHGAGAITGAFAKLAAGGDRYAIVDAIDDSDLVAIGDAAAALPLVTGGSGIALGLPENYRRKGLLGTAATSPLPKQKGPAAILAGSCSIRTREQIAAWTGPAYKIDPDAVMAGAPVADEAAAWAEAHTGERAVLIYASASPEEVGAMQSKYGSANVGERLERTLGDIAVKLVDAGTRRVIAAGGETSGAVVGALGVGALRIGPEIAPGVPWTESFGSKPIALALKSGNFGDVTFFEDALRMLDEQD
jgi:uncharacterized protein YgbK (DUF1537 family)